MNQDIHTALLQQKGIRLAVKREDLIHPLIPGNKYRKLKYNLIKARDEGSDTLLTFGGAYSNHIAATAAAGREYGFKTIGIIRGEELQDRTDRNPTLRFAQEQGMDFRFVSREDFRKKQDESFIAGLRREFGRFYLIPEGGTNELAVKGCEEILAPGDSTYDYVCCAVGTGGTLSGLINSAGDQQKVLGFPALKGSFLNEDICKFARSGNWQLMEGFHFGGYARVDETLVRFINDFRKQTGIPLDPVYTGKMMYGILALVRQGYFENGASILAIHTGGLQGIAGMNRTLERKGLPLIDKD
ncbi:1-aminocyclopropane-1-carboxylate deaminase/D-cysteine desulfhydrase [Sinomicrobium soli]|uniref:1-aminocyclopropane-1-carboxylate deaminase/D-cysteine desulfhydrase n=1 Tax=Sinomicrobium sp. N-1-3-6 TaxID=2219864 RepID=UPI000DCDFDFE|nr:pyridoxal-phosphate dependent enzyme [Sinomicrobium sp. N-1-3-6]RAV30488.1 1-aminocyclopropane-1-carboxylate deaminase/D-cysteine desulfhydrase [Sinomicrobium sp. N-1-3-6]